MNELNKEMLESATIGSKEDKQEIHDVLDVENPEKKLAAWEVLHARIISEGVMVSPAMWTYIFEDPILRESVLQYAPQAEENILNILRDENGIPTRVTGTTIEQYDEENQRWFAVSGEV